MLSFLIDEDLPRSLAGALRASGFEAVDVRDVGLRGVDDTFVFDRALDQRRFLLSGDPRRVDDHRARASPGSSGALT